MTALSLTTQARLTGRLWTNAPDFADANYKIIDRGRAATLSYGTGDNQADTYWDDRRTVTGHDVLNIFTGLKTAFGVTLLITRLKGILIRNLASTDGHVLTILGNALTGAGLTNTTIQPGAMVYVTAPLDGWTISALLDYDEIDIYSGSNEVTYDIGLWGR